MEPWMQVVAWWLAFAGSHTVLSSSVVRSQLIGKFGGAVFQIAYSVLALIVFVGLISAYSNAPPSGPLLWSIGANPVVKVIAGLVALVAFAGIVGSYFQPSPISIIGSAHAARGLMRITRHPLMMSIALWALSHVAINGSPVDVAFFAGFAVYAVYGSAHQDRRKAQDETRREFYQQTSLVPFVAIFQGRNRLVAGELPWLGFLVGAIAGVVIYFAHGWLRG